MKVEPAMPPNPAPHITGWLLELGLQEAGGMAAVPLSWREIEAWQANTCVRLQPWETRLIRRLSSDYVSEGRRAESENAVAPWRAPPTAREIEAAEQALRRLLG